jgi:hypothetical protein
LKQVYVFLDSSRGLVELKSYHVSSSRVSKPPLHCAPRFGHLMQSVLVLLGGVYSPMAHVSQNALLASGALPLVHISQLSSTGCDEAEFVPQTWQL